MSQEASSENKAPAQVGRAAYWGLAVLTFINLFNYLDRFVFPAIAESVKTELDLSDGQLGWIQTGFVVVYMIVSPLFGIMGDKGGRKGLVAAGVGIWSLATAFGGLAGSFWSLFAARASVGIGEAAYGTVAPAMLADYFPKRLRGRIFSVFFLAIPVGSALGYVLGGAVDAAWGWRWAFFVAGGPGLLLALLVLTIKDPKRGQFDDESDAAEGPKGLKAYLALIKNRPYMITVAGYAAYTFALGAVAFWMPSFLQRVRGMEATDATVKFGGIVVVTGLVGTFAGGFLADWWLTRNKQAYLLLSGIATLIAAPFVVSALAVENEVVYMGSLVIAQILIFMSTGPINSAVVDVVPPNMRATAVALSILLIHIFGDVPSPPLIGMLSDTMNNLMLAMMVIPVATAVSGVIWIFGAFDAARLAKKDTSNQSQEL